MSKLSPAVQAIIDRAIARKAAENKQVGFHYNQEQQSFINLALKGESVILIGAAGTGKTTTMKGCVDALIKSNTIPLLKDGTHKYLGVDTYGIVACSYTRTAVKNLRRALPSDLKENCITIHKLLEYEPVKDEVFDPVTLEYKTKMSFEPRRTASFPLPKEIKTIIIDEASMVDVPLFNQIVEALPYPDQVQFIFLGDINQLPPVFNSSVLGYKMLSLPTIELVQIYRQALNSPIINLATDIKEGKTFTVKGGVPLAQETPEGKVVINPWKKKISSEAAINLTAKYFEAAADKGIYNPQTDMILLPFNKAYGTIELNAHLATYFARKREATVYEIIAGFNKIYLSVGDKILYEKEDAEVVSINKNMAYKGRAPQKESPLLNYWGHYAEEEDSQVQESTIDNIDDFLKSVQVDEEKLREASHVVTLKMCDTEREVSLSAVGDISSLLLDYSRTVHKSQGSEWPTVFFCCHYTNNTMLQRELLYTAVTRAKKTLYVICEEDTFERGVKSQKIKGDTLAEKAEFFKGKLETAGLQPL